MSYQIKEIYEFSTFRLDVAERKLLRNGRIVPLTDKAFDTLCVLVRNPAELVTKDEIMSTVWPDAVVEENNLDQKISILRKALGEKGKGKEKFIETVRGHGYRFLPEVVAIRKGMTPGKDDGFREVIHLTDQRSSGAAYSDVRTRTTGNVVAVASWKRPQIDASGPTTGEDEVEGPTEQGGPTTAPASIDQHADKTGLSRRNIALKAVLLSSGLIALVYIGWMVASGLQGNASADSPQIESIAVLPFQNETGDPDNDYLSDGLTESMIGSLSQIPGISVKARSSVFRYKGKDISPESIGRELAVQAVLAGRFTQRGDEVALGLELVDVRTGNVIWSERYDRKATGMIALQSDIARDVANKLRTRLTKSEEQRITKSFTADPDANRLYLQARYHLNKRTPEDIKKSITLFEQASSKDPSYAKAYAGTAEGLLVLPDYAPDLTKSAVKENEERARTAYLRAQTLDDLMPEVHVLAAVFHEIDWDIPAAGRSYRRAIELDPNNATARHWYSVHLACTGRNEEAIEQVNKALELDPFSVSIAFNVGGRFFSARRFDEAIRQFKRVLEMEPGHALTHLLLSQSYDAKGMHTDAIKEGRIASELLIPANASLAANRAADLTVALETAGERGYWEKRLEHIRQDYASGTGSNLKIAACLARLGETEQTLEHLERSFAVRESDMFRVRLEPAFDPMSQDARFVDLLRRTGLQN